MRKQNLTPALMTEGEIRTSYQQAADKDTQIDILAELNAVKREVIEQILFGEVITKPKRKYSRPDEATKQKIAREHLEDGLSVKELAEKYGKTSATIKKYIDHYEATAAADRLEPDPATDQTYVPDAEDLPMSQSMEQLSDQATNLCKTMGLLFDAITAFMERVEQDCVGYDELIITKSSQRISCVMEKGGINVNLSKEISANEGGAGDA